MDHPEGCVASADLSRGARLVIALLEAAFSSEPGPVPAPVVTAMVAEAAGESDGTLPVIDGFMAVCCGLLGLLDHEFGMEPEEALRRLTEVYSVTGVA